ncbi:carcinine transporter [Caerostris extrusa]|uniref:Carcinine transporter n=1 Tax=Caerostris extrusa TaxID=172846 RepID=A0AAV4XMM7_CAEEX|nr:carcinine transporter [Caerostris extrusa]
MHHVFPKLLSTGFEFKSSGKFPEIKTIGKIISKRPENKCNHGWVYQKEWYEETIVSKWDLVCDNNYLPSLVLTPSQRRKQDTQICCHLKQCKPHNNKSWFIECVQVFHGCLNMPYRFMLAMWSLSEVIRLFSNKILIISGGNSGYRDDEIMYPSLLIRKCEGPS